MKDIKKGAKGRDVGDLQKALNKAGAKPPLKTDEIFGKATEAALKKFQARGKLDVSGVTDMATQHALKIGPKPKTDDKTPTKLLSNVTENIAALDGYLSQSKDTGAMFIAMAKFLKKGEQTVAVQRKQALATLNTFKQFHVEISGLRKEYDKVKLTKMSRADAILARIAEIEKAIERVKADYNKLESADSVRLAKMMQAFEKG